MACGGAMVLAKASSWLIERAGVDEATERGIPAGGVGLTAMVGATPSPCATDGLPAAVGPLPRLAGTDWSDGAVGPGAGLAVEAGVGGPERRCPQCWQKAKPDGVCLPQAG